MRTLKEEEVNAKTYATIEEARADIGAFIETSGLDPHQTRRQRSEEGQQLRAPDRFGHHHRAGGVDAMNLEHILRDIEPDSRDSGQIPDRLFHGRLPSDGSDNASWHIDAGRGAVHPITVILLVIFF